MAETIRKIIVDCRYFISGDAGSGIYELPEVVEIHGTQMLHLEQFSTINSWLSVDETNNQFYLVEWTYGVENSQVFNIVRPRVLMLPIVAYDANSLVSQLETLLNGVDKMVISTYQVTRSLNDPDIQATSKSLLSNFTITLVPPAGGLPHGANHLVKETFFPVPDMYLRDPTWHTNYG